MAKGVRSDVDVAGFLIEIGGKSAAQFVRRDALHRNRRSCVFFDQALDGPNRDPLAFS